MENLYKIIFVGIFTKHEILFNNGDNEFLEIVSYFQKDTNDLDFNNNYRFSNYLLMVINGTAFLCKSNNCPRKILYKFLQDLNSSYFLNPFISQEEIMKLADDRIKKMQ